LSWHADVTSLKSPFSFRLPVPENIFSATALKKESFFKFYTIKAYLGAKCYLLNYFYAELPAYSTKTPTLKDASED